MSKAMRNLKEIDMHYTIVDVNRRKSIQTFQKRFT